MGIRLRCFRERPLIKWINVEKGSGRRTGLSTRPIKAGAGHADPLRPGEHVGDYRILDVIAAGGFGTVYRAQHLTESRRAAVKVLHRELLSHKEAVTRFEREARIFHTIKHPNVVDIFEFGRLPDGRPYFVMELLLGQDLHTKIDECGRWTLDEVISILEPLCDGLSVVHERGIVHRDLKASNVFLHAAPEGRRVVLLDFGIAKLLDPGATELTTSHHAIGTPACMAPEQITGGEVTARTDVYALGALTYHMLAGALPFADSSVTMMQHMHLHAHRPRLSLVVPAAKALDDVVMRAMSRNPNDRYPSVTAFADAIRTALTPTPKGRTRSAPALGVHFEILVSAQHLDEPDELLLDEIDALDSEVMAALEAIGLRQILGAGRAALFVRPFSEHDAHTAQIREALELARTLMRSLPGRPRGDRRASLAFVLRTGAVLIDETDGSIVGGDLAHLSSFCPSRKRSGVFIDRTLAADLEVRFEDSPGDLVRLLE